MSAKQFAANREDRIEKVTEAAGTDPATTADTAMGSLLTDLNTTVQALESAVTDAIAAAQLIGAGDASAEIDAIDVAWVAILAAIDAAQTQATTTKAATLAAVPAKDVEVAIKDGVPRLGAIDGLKTILQRLGVTKLF